MSIGKYINKNKIGAVVLIIVIIIAFGFGGFGGGFLSNNQNNIAKINKTNITTKDFINYLNQTGISQKAIKDNLDDNIIEELLSGLVSTTLLDLEIKDFNINFSEKSISKEIKSNKNFIDENLNDICASIQKNLIDNLLNKVESLSNENNLKTIVFGGGVSANSYLKSRMKKASKTNNWKVYIPKLEYSTDNAAMIGIVGHLKYKDSIESNLSSTPSPRLTF